MPDHADFLVAFHRCRAKSRINRFAYCVELVISRNLLDDSAVVFKKDEVVQIVQQQITPEQTASQRFRLARRAQGINRRAVNHAPLHKAFLVAGERPTTGSFIHKRC
jgi:hypothetical protein